VARRQPSQGDSTRLAPHDIRPTTEKAGAVFPAAHTAAAHSHINWLHTDRQQCTHSWSKTSSAKDTSCREDDHVEQVTSRTVWNACGWRLQRWGLKGNEIMINDSLWLWNWPGLEKISVLQHSFKVFKFSVQLTWKQYDRFTMQLHRLFSLMGRLRANRRIITCLVHCRSFLYARVVFFTVLLYWICHFPMFFWRGMLYISRSISLKRCFYRSGSDISKINTNLPLYIMSSLSKTHLQCGAKLYKNRSLLLALLRSLKFDDDDYACLIKRQRT